MEQETKRRLFEDKTWEEVKQDLLIIFGVGGGLVVLGYLLSLMGIETIEDDLIEK